MFDINGLLASTRKDLVDFQKPYAHQHAPTRDFVTAIESIKPTTIIGVSTIGGVSRRRSLEDQAADHLSNPDFPGGLDSAWCKKPAVLLIVPELDQRCISMRSAATSLFREPSAYSRRLPVRMAGLISAKP
jgi:hypothetical protein